MCYERRRAEACVDESAHHALGPVRNPVLVYAQVGGRFVQIDSFEVCGVVLYVCFEPSWGADP